jgi:hypothetical protein
MEGYRIRAGERLQIAFTTVATDTLSASIRVLYDDGTQDDIFINPSSTGGANGVVESINRANKNGWVVSLDVSVPSSSTTLRGQIYVQAFTTDGVTRVELGRGWVYLNTPLSLGDNIEQLNVLNSNVVGAAQTSIGNGSVVGDIIVLDSGDIAGNVGISIPTATPSSFQLFEMLQFEYSALCDATVATRTPTPFITTGMNRVTGYAASPDFVVASALPSLTASQQGSIWMGRASSLVQINDNGSMSTGVASPLPLYFSAQSLSITCTLAAGVAGDLHRITTWCRRIA